MELDEGLRQKRKRRIEAIERSVGDLRLAGIPGAPTWLSAALYLAVHERACRVSSRVIPTALMSPPMGVLEQLNGVEVKHFQSPYLSNYRLDRRYILPNIISTCPSSSAPRMFCFAGSVLIYVLKVPKSYY